MKKIALITLNGYENYGNRLQNYALSETIKKIIDYPCKVETLEIMDEESAILRIKKTFYYLLHFNLNTNKRYRLFKQFTLENIPTRKIKSTSLQAKRYYKYVCGSDQIWNTDFAGKDWHFAKFAPAGNIISYAASIGTDTIYEKEKERFSKLLNRFTDISVRENEAKEIINEFLDRKVSVHVDPTMLLSYDEWISVSKKPNYKIPDKFILAYFLGEFSFEEENYIKDIEKKYNYSILFLVEKKQNDIWYKTGPSEFLYLLNKSELVITDSFHGSVFSIIMDKPVIIFDRKDEKRCMGSRIESLTKNFNIENRKNCNIDLKYIFDHDYTNAYNVLELQKKKSIEYLKKALCIK